MFFDAGLGTAAITRFDVAAPFLANAFVLLLGPFGALAIEHRFAATYRRWDRSVEAPPLPGHHDPDQVAETTVWAIDASQILIVLLGPIAGLLILHPNINAAVSVVYIAVIVLSVAGFLAFVFLTAPDAYKSDWIWIFSPVNVGAIVVSLLAGGIAAAIGP